MSDSSTSSRQPRARPRLSWDLVLLIAFVPGSAWSIVVSIFEPLTIGSHGWIYSAAAQAWLTGGDPWRVGPPAAVFAGPPTMLLPFAVTAFASFDLSRFSWLAIDLVVAVWALRRLGMPAYWLIFPPLFEAIVLGHPEVLVLGLLAIRHPIAGLAMLIKPYAALPFLAERRWWAFVVAAIGGLVTLPLLPWGLFFDELGYIGATIARQNVGDSVFGQPILMVVAVLALAVLGPRRALWLGVPVLWPSAQPIYKTMTIPMLPPVVALAWAIPIPGATLAGVVVLAALVLFAKRRRLPDWVRRGMEPMARPLEPSAGGESTLGRAAVLGTGPA